MEVNSCTIMLMGRGILCGVNKRNGQSGRHKIYLEMKCLHSAWPGWMETH